jgi:gas vesicle protein
MADTREHSLGTLLTAFLAGAAIGAVVVALTTPKRGDELREELADLLERLRSRLEGADDANNQT